MKIAEAVRIEISSEAQHCFDPFQIPIRIYHECEGRIEKFVPRIAVLHHEACRMMTNGDPKGMNFSILLSLE